MQYEPLDKTKNEIRVLEFLNLSSPVLTEDIVQCSVRNVSLPSSFDSQLHQQGSQKRKFPIAWDKFTKSVDLRDSALEQTRLNAAVHAGLHRRYPQCNGSRYDWGDFEALSYTWGNASETNAININGVRKSVPRNLEEALRALQSQEETHLGMCYWVDSLCIDQENIEERNEQVKRMQEIYGRARAVIVWLGQKDEQDRIAVQRMHGRCAEDRTPQSHSELLALLAFAQKPYWNRCWIIQELAMNHNSTLFMCGELKLTRRLIQRGIRSSQRLLAGSDYSNRQPPNKFQRGTFDMVQRIHDLTTLTSETDFGMTPKSLLDIVRQAGATDERDKIYSILGLLDSDITAGVTPNYSLSVRQVYTNFMKSFINASKRLERIAFGGTSAEQGWPSWVPDWREPFQRHNVEDLILRKPRRGLPAHFRFIEKEIDRTYLACSGFQVDTVDGIAAEPPLDSHATQSGTVSDRYSGRTLEAIENSFRMKGLPINSMLLFKIPWNLSHDIDDSLANVPSDPEWLKLFQSSNFERWDKFRKHNKDFCISGRKFQTFFAQSVEQEQSSVEQQQSSVEQRVKIAIFRRFTHSALDSLDHRALITTRTGYVGLAPVAARPGDVVVILLGCCWPVVLRPCDDGLYQVIGECYMPGFMNGEILDQQREGLVSEQEFVLC